MKDFQFVTVDAQRVIENFRMVTTRTFNIDVPLAVEKKARKYAARNFDRKVHVKKYVQLYENLLRRKGNG